jgi:hypothetical protein
MQKTTLVLLASALAIAPLACSKQEEAKIQAAMEGDALVEKLDFGKIGWNIASDGKVKVLVEDAAGKPASKAAAGSLVYTTAGGAMKTVPLAFDEKLGALVADGPKLEADLNEVKYSLTVDGKPATGTLYLPAGGTAELASEAKAQGDAVVTADAKSGPHGGIVQTVGADHLEIVSDGKEEVRVYVLDAALKPVPVESRTVKLGVVSDKPEVVVLAAEPEGRFLTGKWHVTGDPVRLTIAEHVDAKTKVVLVGYRPGVQIVVGPSAPKWKIVTKEGAAEKWDAPGTVAGVKLQGNGNPIGTGMGKGHGEGNGNGNGGGNGNDKEKAKEKGKADEHGGGKNKNK